MLPYRHMKEFISSAAAPKAALLLIIGCAAAFMLQSSFRESAVMDELAHIPAGYGYVRALDYRLNPEHPPLVKALAALPLLGLNPTFPRNDTAWTEGVNEQWTVGAEFLYGRDGNNPDTIIRLARLGPMLLALLLIFTVYAAGRKVLGDRLALLPALLVAFSPIFLAHGHYVTTDVGASFGILWALWRFAEFLRDPSRKNLWHAGLALGIAELLKFSAVLLIPTFIFLALIYILSHRNSFRKITVGLIAVFCIGYALVVYPAYALFTLRYPVAKQASDTRLILHNFDSGLFGRLAELDARLADHRLTHPAAQYLLGVLMVKERSTGGNTAYFFGKVSAAGSRWYFPAAYALKETLPALLILFIGFCCAAAAAWRAITARRQDGQNLWSDCFLPFLRGRFFEFSALVFIVLYWTYSIRSPLNIGVRHILPTVPLLYIIAAAAWRAPIQQSVADRQHATVGKTSRRKLWPLALLSALLVWSAGEAVFAAPHFLSYYNELAGGTANGYRFIDDSNYDWGQDLLALRDILDAHPEIDRIAVDYFGGGNAHYYLGEREVDWSSEKGDPRMAGIHWLAVSLNPLQEAIQPAAPGYARGAEKEYSWLTAARPRQPGMGGIPEPDLRAGTSILIYHLP